MPSPWYITRRAVEEYCELRGWPDDDEHFDRAEDELLVIAEVAHHVRDQDNGLQLWRAPKPTQIRLLVSTAKRPEGELPQLVRVLPQSDRGSGAVIRDDVAPAEHQVDLQCGKVALSKIRAWRAAATRDKTPWTQWVVDALDRAARPPRPPRPPR